MSRSNSSSGSSSRDSSRSNSRTGCANRSVSNFYCPGRGPVASSRTTLCCSIYEMDHCTAFGPCSTRHMTRTSLLVCVESCCSIALTWLSITKHWSHHYGREPDLVPFTYPGQLRFWLSVPILLHCETHRPNGKAAHLLCYAIPGNLAIERAQAVVLLAMLVVVLCMEISFVRFLVTIRLVEKQMGVLLESASGVHWDQESCLLSYCCCSCCCC